MREEAKTRRPGKRGLNPVPLVIPGWTTRKRTTDETHRSAVRALLHLSPKPKTAVHHAIRQRLGWTYVGQTNGGRVLPPHLRHGTRPVAPSSNRIRVRGQVWCGKRSHDETQNDPRGGEEGAGTGWTKGGLQTDKQDPSCVGCNTSRV